MEKVIFKFIYIFLDQYRNLISSSTGYNDDSVYKSYKRLNTRSWYTAKKKRKSLKPL